MKKNKVLGVGCWVLGVRPKTQYLTPNTQHLRRRRQHGFTLVEMIVATILLVVGVVAALVCIAGATHSTGLASDYTTAALLAQQRFAEIEAQPDQLRGGGQQGDFGDQYPGFSWQQAVEPTNISGVARVTLTIELPGARPRRSAQFVTYERTQQQ